MLQECLDVGMLEIGDDDDKFKYLVLASTDLKDVLLEERAKLISYTLVALDPQIPTEDPVLIEVEDAIKKHWRSFKNRFADTSPRPLLRAVILEALELAAMKDSTCASPIWLTGSSFLPFAKLGREEEICRDFFNLCGQTMEQSAIEEWQSAPSSAPKRAVTSPKPPTFAVEAPKVKNVSVSQAFLIETFSAAVGVSADAEGNAISEPNPNYPFVTGSYATLNQSWGPEFAKRAATGLSQALNSSNKSQSEAHLAAVAEMLESFGGEVSKYLPAMALAMQKTVYGAVQRSAVVERESALLWWDRTLYSESLKCSYRSLDPCVAIVLMAHDLAEKVPAPHPQSIEYLLREVVRDVVSSQEIEEPVASVRGRKPSKATEQSPESPAKSEPLSHVSLKTFFGSLKTAPEAAQLNSILQCQTIETGRMSLFQFICDVLSDGDVRKQRIAARIGLREDDQLSFENLAVWIFRGLQTQRMTR